MEQAIVYIGIDVAKAYLDVSWAGEARRFSNEKKGHAALVRWLKTSQRPVQLICEASGGYEQALLKSLAEQDLAVTLVKPYGCVNMRVQLASWPKRIESMPECWQLLVRRWDPNPPHYYRANRSICANWSP